MNAATEHQRKCDRPRKCYRCDGQATREVFGWASVGRQKKTASWLPVCDLHNIFTDYNQRTAPAGQEKDDGENADD